MRISLEYFLNKQNITLKSFCKKNRIDSYELLEAYCSGQNLVIADHGHYASVFTELAKSQPKNAPDIVDKAEEPVIKSNKKAVDDKQLIPAKALKDSNAKKEKQTTNTGTRSTTRRRRSGKKSTK